MQWKREEEEEGFPLSHPLSPTRSLPLLYPILTLSPSLILFTMNRRLPTSPTITLS